MQKPVVSVIIPVYNEVGTLEECLRRIKAVLLPDVQLELVVVNDGSTDGSEALIESLRTSLLQNALIIHKAKNEGKGAALRKGFEVATGEITLIQDADLEYDPNDYSALLQPILDGQARVVYGSRILHPENKTHSALRFYFGGKLVTLVTNILYGSKITDEPTCYKVFKTPILKQLDLTCMRFEFCPEVTAKLLMRGVKIHEVPIRYYPRKPEDGKKIGWFDGVEAVWTLFRLRFIG
jgi:dolichol-phosphate mannosyltransferase